MGFECGPMNYKALDRVTGAYGMALEKLAYGPKEHAALASRAVAVASDRKAGAGVRRLVQSAALKADKGIRHPFLPHTDNIHSFAGSQTKKTVGKNVLRKQDAAVRDIAKSIGDRSLRGRLTSGTRAARGLGNLGEATHQLADIGAHYEKPVEQGFHASRLRRALPHSGYGGGVVGGLEHVRSGMSLTPHGPSSIVDKLRPKLHAADAASVSRSGGMGSSTARKIRRELMKSHGHSEESAGRAVQHFFATRNPSKISRVVGEASRDSRYLKGETRRAVVTAGKGLKKGLNLLRRGLRR